MSCYPCNINCVDQVVGTTTTTTTTTCPDAISYDAVYTTDCVIYTGCDVPCFSIQNGTTLTSTVSSLVIAINNCLFPPPTTTSTTTTSTTSTTSTTTSTTSTSSTTTTTTQALCSLYDYTLGYDNAGCDKACSNFVENTVGDYYSCCTAIDFDCIIYTSISRDVQAGFYSDGVDCYETNIDGKIISITPCVAPPTTTTSTSTTTTTTVGPTTTTTSTTEGVTTTTTSTTSTTTTSTTSTTSTTTTTTAAPLGAGQVEWTVSGSGGTYETIITKLPSTSILNTTGPTSGSTSGNGDYLVQLTWTGSGTIMQYLICKSIGALTTTYATFGPTVPGGGSTSISLNVLSGEIYSIYVLYGPGTLAPCSI